MVYLRKKKINNLSLFIIWLLLVNLRNRALCRFLNRNFMCTHIRVNIRYCLLCVMGMLCMFIVHICYTYYDAVASSPVRRTWLHYFFFLIQRIIRIVIVRKTTDVRTFCVRAPRSFRRYIVDNLSSSPSSLYVYLAISDH